MTNFTHSFKAMTLGFLMVLGIIGSATANQLYASAAPGTKEYSGEQLVRGILLADGVVAQQIPELSEFSIENFTTDQKMRTTIADFNNKVIDQISRDQPSFFDTFKSQMYSHQHATIRSGINAGKSIVLAAINKVNAKAQVSMDQETKALAQEIAQKMGSAGSIDQAADIAKNYLASQSEKASAVSGSYICVAHATVAVAVSVAVAFYTEYYFWPEAANLSVANNQIFQETIINSIATKL